MSDVHETTLRALEDTARPPTPLERYLLMPAVGDWVLAGYFMSVVVGLGRAANSAERNAFLGLTTLVLGTFIACVYLYRIRFERLGRTQPGYFARLGYHLLPLVALLSVYFNLRPILPLINGSNYDEALYRLDVRVFGVEPTLALEPYTTPRVVEWFSFFYYSYFFMVASFVFVHIFSQRDDRRLSWFATGVLIICAIGHFSYTLVPGIGPYAHLAHEFDAPLRGGVFYDLILRAVSAAGPLRDIFPSLHTALPTYCALFAWRHYRKFAPVASFFAANIMIATVVLRWHYALDVVAGLLLAGFAFWISPKLVELYQSRREAIGLGALRRW